MQGSQHGIDCHSCHAQAASTQLAVLPETGARTGGRVLQALASLEGNWSEEATAAGARWVPRCAACGDSLVSRGDSALEHCASLCLADPRCPGHVAAQQARAAPLPQKGATGARCAAARCPTTVHGHASCTPVRLPCFYERPALTGAPTRQAACRPRSAWRARAPGTPPGSAARRARRRCARCSS